VAEAVAHRVESDDLTAGPSLSVCLLTAGPAARVAALLALLRPVAGELVVGLDERAEPEVGRSLAAVADRVVRHRYLHYNRSLTWLFSLCSGDWILAIDDDEVPSAELLAALPALVAATDVTHYWLLRRWLWPDPQSTICEHPWSTDYQLRLVRNDPLLLRFPSETHRPVEALGPHRFVRAPLYHADLLLRSAADRAEKARAYEALRPAKRIGGGPLNHVFYLPEHRDRLRREPLPPIDAELVRTVLDAVAAPQLDVAVPTADEAEVEQLWAGRRIDHRATLELLDEPAQLRACESRTYDVRVRNLSGTTWPWGEQGEPEVRLSYEWLDGAGALVEYGLRTPLPADLGPGEAAVVPVHVRAPAQSGRYGLRFALVHEHVCWFADDVEVEVDVEPRLRIALVGGDEAVRRSLAQLADEAPAFEPLVLTGDEREAKYGPAWASDLRAYLLAGTAHGRLRDLALLAGRTATLLRVAGRLHAGLPVRPLPRGAQQCLDELAASTHVLLVAGETEDGTRELWLQLGTVAAARRLGLAVLVQEGALARPGGTLDAVLVRAVRRRAQVVPAGRLGVP